MPMIVLDPKTFTAAGPANIVLNDPGTSAVGRWLVDAKLSGGTGTIKAGKRLKVDASVTAHAFADCWYTTALDNTAHAAGATQSASCLLDIDASGCDVQLTYTTDGSGGTWEIFATPLLG